MGWALLPVIITIQANTINTTACHCIKPYGINLPRQIAPLKVACFFFADFVSGNDIRCLLFVDLVGPTMAVATATQGVAARRATMALVLVQPEHPWGNIQRMRGEEGN